jgi:hypothetical protein
MNTNYRVNRLIRERGHIITTRLQRVNKVFINYVMGLKYGSNVV